MRDALPPGKPTVVLGWSFSGPLAIRLTALPASCSSRRSPAIRTRVQGSCGGLVLRSWVVSLFLALSHAKALLGGYATPALRTARLAADKGPGNAAPSWPSISARAGRILAAAHSMPRWDGQWEPSSS